MFGFIRRRCCDLKHIQCLKTVYYSLVRSNIEYSSIPWNPSQHGHGNIQSYFLRHLSYKFKINCSTKDLDLRLGIHFLSSRRKSNDVSFIFKIINGTVIYLEISEQMGWLVFTFYTMSKTTFYKLFHKQKYRFNEFKGRMLRARNSLVNFDFNLYS